MAVRINGTGTLTGVSVGGLPDGIVDTDMLAANAVTDAKENLSGTAKAWIRFDGTGTPSITDSFNCSSITEVDDGNNTVAFTNAFANTNYAAVVNGSDDDNGMFSVILASAINTGNCRVITRQNRTTSRTGVGYTTAVFFGDQ